MPRRGFLLLMFACAVLTCTASQAQFGVPLGRDDHSAEPARIRALVAQYCRLDYEGDRLTAQDWPKMQSVVAYKENPDFPLVSIVSRYTVDETPVPERTKYTVGVHYFVSARFAMGQGLTKEVTSEDATFTVSQVNGEWRVSNVEANYPRVSRPAMLKWLNAKLSSTDDAAAKPIYEQAIQGLQPAPTAAPAQK